MLRMAIKDQRRGLTMNKVSLVRKILVYIAYILFLTCFQVSFPDRLGFRGQIADLMFVFVSLVSYMFGFWDGIFVSLAVGILRDSFAAPAVVGFGGQTLPSIGIGALVMLLNAVFSSSVFTVKLKRKVPFAFLTVLTATVAYKVLGHLVIWIWNAVFTDNSYRLTMSQILLDSIGVQVILNLVCSAFLYLLLRFAGPYRKGINSATEDKDLMGGDSSWLTI